MKEYIAVRRIYDTRTGNHVQPGETFGLDDERAKILLASGAIKRAPVKAPPSKKESED